jgi:Tol biopolymer transport system component
VLPPEVAQDEERLARFRREAHLLASLNHPNIAAIYGLEEANGKPFLALELVEGEDLKQRLARGAIPVDEALEIAEQIALGLEEAHAKGIVHRDLKPANVKLAPDGKVKVLDFGLAKAWAGDAAEGGSSSSALSQSPTLAHTGTAAGLILGTAAYMSPEQARGKPVDKRADVWAFGVLLWEMLTGRALFAGDTVTDVIAAVVTREPDLDALPAATPPAVRRLITRCLWKDPRRRLPDIGAARLELQTVQRICAIPSTGNAGADWSKQGTILFSAGGLSGRIYSVAATGGEARPLTALDASRGENHHHVPQFLPDGRRFLFLIGATQEENSGLYLASLEAPAERRQVARGWRRYAYADGHLPVARGGTLFAQPFDAKRAKLSGEPVAIASSVASWIENAAIGWFGVSPGGTLASLSGQRMTGMEQLAWLDRKGGQIRTVGAPGKYAQFTVSPDERNVALEIGDAAGEIDLWVMDLARGVASRVTTTPGYEGNPVWSPDGRSLAFNATRDKGVELHRKGLRASDPETVLTDSPDEDYPEDWSRDGRTLLFKRRSAENAESLWALPLTGGGDAVPVVNTGFPVDEPQLSPDGAWLAYISRESGRDEVYVEPFRRDGERVRVSTNGGGQPKWRGDGKELFYTTPDSRLVVVAVRTVGDRLGVDLPTDLFVIPGIRGTIYDDYAVSADGQRFLVKLPVEENRKPQLHIVTNWTSLLQ